MKKTVIQILTFITILAMLLVAVPLQQAQAAGGGSGSISLTALGTAYTQNFDTLANTSTTNSLTINGWFLDESGTSAMNNGLYAAGIGSSNTGDTYSFGASSNAERAFGGLLSGSLNPTIGAQFTNNTGETVTALDISYIGEMWRAGVTNRNAADRLDFQLSTNATSLTTGTWVDYDSLDFNSPNINTTAGALNGNSTQNKAIVSFSITGPSIPNGSSFWIRWTDFNISSSDDGLAIDDFSLIPSVEDQAPVVAGTTPGNGSTDIEYSADITVDFNEAVNVTDTWFDINCANSGAYTAIVSGGPSSFVLNPDADFTSNEVCTVTIYATQVVDQDLLDPPDNMEADYAFSFTTLGPPTFIHDIQGASHMSPMNGTLVYERQRHCDSQALEWFLPAGPESG